MDQYEPRVFLAGLPNGVFVAAGASWKAIKTIELKERLQKRGIKHVVPTRIDQVLSLDLSPRDIVIYTSSDESEIRSFVKDVMFIVNEKAHVIPRYEHLLAHENKGFQQLYREYGRFGELTGGYFFDLDLVNNVDRPFVAKTISGAGSSGVTLVKSDRDIRAIRKKHFSQDLYRKAIKFARRVKLSADEYEIYAYRHKGFRRMVWQEYLAGLDFDYKVLVFDNKFWVLQRSVEKGDFRASGSGNRQFLKPPTNVLDYAKSVMERLVAPYASLDIAVRSGRCHLIEYQVLNFGPYTLIHSPGYSIQSSEGWSWVDGQSSLVDEYAAAISAWVMRGTQGE